MLPGKMLVGIAAVGKPVVGRFANALEMIGVTAALAGRLARDEMMPVFTSGTVVGMILVIAVVGRLVSKMAGRVREGKSETGSETSMGLGRETGGTAPTLGSETGRLPATPPTLGIETGSPAAADVAGAAALAETTSCQSRGQSDVRVDMLTRRRSICTQAEIEARNLGSCRGQAGQGGEWEQHVSHSERMNVFVSE